MLEAKHEVGVSVRVIMSRLPNIEDHEI
jgi:hypothetical protein